MIYNLRRARFVAKSVPRDPTVAEIPFDLLIGEGHGETPTRVALATVVVTPQQTDQVDRMLAEVE
ncbi:hypothetical protein [Mycobacterium lepromatosis]|uniref:hypothetical protein n=1 Tax=Mycobacterium lepromatosis TaxID=480418 RepID=UPI0005F7D929|nr:hypothetical protein [Mycobacterium lepromatosis]